MSTNCHRQFWRKNRIVQKQGQLLSCSNGQLQERKQYIGCSFSAQAEHSAMCEEELHKHVILQNLGVNAQVGEK